MGGYLGDPGRAHRYFNKKFALAPGSQWSRRSTFILLGKSGKEWVKAGKRVEDWVKTVRAG